MSTEEERRMEQEQADDWASWESGQEEDRARARNEEEAEEEARAKEARELDSRRVREE